ncbi:phosphoribosylglycinamide formyltransferase [Exidia glandulosa HHB12029]|uniref:Phosphoribosylglycinamide formyltransferase n=1 Tax=Exidia glandulosa HHB12029 TaxID=1314781 RepID=A0A165D519_EXIGL|nr:phosphoribosylglycinamide formyltransferase [Exidia glandulosa HHB12029]
MSRRRIAVLISGSGSNLQALIDATKSGVIPNAEICVVLSNRKAAYGLERARNEGIPTEYLALQPFLKKNPEKTRDDYDAEIARMVLKHSPDLVVLAGWMHILGDGFLEIVYADQESRRPLPVINLHPALPGAFDGANALDRAYEAFQKGEITYTGAMVHRVVKDVDRGEPVVVRQIDFVPGEPQDAFETRLHKVEWEIIVEATNKILQQL